MLLSNWPFFFFSASRRDGRRNMAGSKTIGKVIVAGFVGITLLGMSVTVPYLTPVKREVTDIPKRDHSNNMWKPGGRM